MSYFRNVVSLKNTQLETLSDMISFNIPVFNLSQVRVEMNKLIKSDLQKKKKTVI